MSNLEHLIESAIYYVEYYSFEEFQETWLTNINKQSVITPLKEIWEIANYIYYTYRPHIEYLKDKETIEKYGYEIKD